MRNLYFLFLFLLTSCSPARETAVYTRTVPLMGTFVEVKLPAEEAEKVLSKDEISKAVDSVFTLAAELEKKFNVFDPKSELNLLNKAKEAVVSRELYEVLDFAKKMSGATGGRFDPTVAPIMKKSGFYRGMPRSLLIRIPDDYAKDGWKNIVLSSPEQPVVLNGGVWLDLSGIAAGYIVDRMADLFRKRGLRYFMINAGGDIYCGKKSDQEKWQVGVAEPGAKDGVLLTLALEDAAVTTSGDYENWLEGPSGGKDISHIVDPSKGGNMEKTLSSATVITSFCMQADALATAMMAARSDEAMRIAAGMKGINVIMIEKRGKKFDVRFSPGAERYVIWQKI